MKIKQGGGIRENKWFSLRFREPLRIWYLGFPGTENEVRLKETANHAQIKGEALLGRHISCSKTLWWAQTKRTSVVGTQRFKRKAVENGLRWVEGQA